MPKVQRLKGKEKLARLPIFYMLVGLPGSGKTTWAMQNLGANSVYLSTDSIIEDMAVSLGKTYNDIFKDIIGPAQKIVDNELYLHSYPGKNNLCLDQTNLSPKSRKRKLDLVAHPGYKKIAVYFDTPINVIEKRLEVRNKSGKIITKRLLEDLQATFVRPSLAEGFDEIKPVLYLDT
jgi:predicted kinase